MSVALTIAQKTTAWSLKAKLSTMVSSMLSSLTANIDTALASKQDKNSTSQRAYFLGAQ